MVQYKKIDFDVADAALNTFQGHYWYLVEETVVFSIFGELPYTEKDKIAKTLCSYKIPQDFERGQPIFPKLKQGTKIHQLIGPKSWFIFKILGSSYEWLKSPSISWKSINEYSKIQKILASTKVVNDTAERGVKLIQDLSVNVGMKGNYRNYSKLLKTIGVSFQQQLKRLYMI